MGLFGGTTVNAYTPPPIDVGQANREAAAMVKATPAEVELLKKLGISADQADQGMLDALRGLTARGEDLANVNEDYMNMAYKPAYDRLMNDYTVMDRGILEDMNRRGVSGGPGAASEPEAYQRMLLARDTKQKLSDNILSAQAQAVNQKLQQYQARTAEPQMAAVRYGQTMTPLQEKTIVPESERQANKVGAAGNIYNARLGYASNMANIQGAQKMQQNQNYMNLIGSGMGVAGAGIGLMSDPALKKDREPGPAPEQDLAELSDTPVDRWKYRWEDSSTPMHEGAMADEAPADTQVPGGIDIPSYLGKLTNAVKALNTKMSAYERLQMGGA